LITLLTLRFALQLPHEPPRCVTTTYGYDAFGARVLQTGTTTTTFYPFKWYSVASSTGTGAKYATTTSYVFNGDALLATVDQQTASGVATGTAQTRFIHPDHLGSTNVVTDQNDNLVQTLDYYPYGGTRISVSTGGTNEGRKYIGQFADSSGLEYFNARYYSGDRGQFISEDPSFLSVGDPNQVRQVTGRNQQTFLADPQLANSYSYGRDNPITQKDPDGKIVPIILGALAVYSAAQISIDAYDVYQTDFKYANVFSPQEKSRTNFKLGYDATLSALGEVAALPSIGLKGYGIALDALSATQDALDTYFGPQIYKTYNDERNPNKKQDSSANVSVPSVNVAGGSYTKTSSINTSYISRQTNVQYSGQSGGSGGSSYGQLVSSLSRLVASLSAYVSGLSANKGK